MNDTWETLDTCACCAPAFCFFGSTSVGGISRWRGGRGDEEVSGGEREDLINNEADEAKEDVTDETKAGEHGEDVLEEKARGIEKKCV